MVVHISAELFGGFDYNTLVAVAATTATAYAVKVFAGGKKCTWEREWAGKLIMIAAAPTPTTLALIDHLLQLPSPPQILYLPPYESPLPEALLTLMHAMRLTTTNPLAQLHCEPLPRTPTGVREFVRKWASPLRGTAGEGGRRVDAIVLGGAWECDDGTTRKRDIELEKWEDPEWTTQQFHFHLITALLPSLLRAPPERNIRIIQLVSPAWSAALPGIQAELENKPYKAKAGLLPAAGRRGVISLSFQEQLKLILDTLASATYGKAEVVPDPNATVEDGAEVTVTKKRDESIQSNILSLSVVMPWARDEVVRPVWGAGSMIKWILYLLLLPIVLILTRGPAKTIQPILFALSAPVKFPGDVDDDLSQGNKNAARSADEAEEREKRLVESGKSSRPEKDDLEPRRAGVRQGDVVRDCAVIDVPPVLHDPLLTRATYEKLEKQVELGVKASEARAKAFPRPIPTATKEEDGPPRETKVKFAEPSKEELDRAAEEKTE